MDIHSVSLDYASYKKRLDRLGSPWAWEKRPKYQDQQAIEERISDPRSKLFDLTIDHKDVGYCLVVPRDDLSEEFGVSVSEIENFAIDVDYNGRGYGSPFFRYVCKDIFSNYAEAIFLSTRSTNHDKVLPFYERLGMKIIKQEVMRNDLK